MERKETLSGRDTEIITRVHLQPKVEHGGR